LQVFGDLLIKIYHICLLLTNICAYRKMTHDPQTYVNLRDFEPARFLPGEGREPELDPRNIVFGFDRRFVILELLFYVH
jgi:hypothetical protein